MVPEDGTGLEDADSYVTLEEAVEYCVARNLTFSASPDVLGASALIRASKAIDLRYQSAYPGWRKRGREQGLQWPRAAAYDVSGWLIRDDEVPVEIKYATIEAAVRELAEPNSMMPDLERGGQIASIRAGSVGITYSSSAPARTTFTLIDGMLGNILSGIGSTGGPPLFGLTVRT